MVYIFVQPSLAIKFVNWLDVDSKPNIWVIFFSLMIHTQHRWSMKRRVSTQLAFGRIHETCHWFGMLTFIRKWMLKKGIQIKIHQKLTINDVKCSQYRSIDIEHSHSVFRKLINQSISIYLYVEVIFIQNWLHLGWRARGERHHKMCGKKFFFFRLRGLNGFKSRILKNVHRTSERKMSRRQ